MPSRTSECIVDSGHDEVSSVLDKNQCNCGCGCKDERLACRCPSHHSGVLRGSHAIAFRPLPSIVHVGVMDEACIGHDFRRRQTHQGRCSAKLPLAPVQLSSLIVGWSTSATTLSVQGRPHPTVYKYGKGGMSEPSTIPRPSRVALLVGVGKDSSPRR